MTEAQVYNLKTAKRHASRSFPQLLPRNVMYRSKHIKIST